MIETYKLKGNEIEIRDMRNQGKWDKDIDMKNKKKWDKDRDMKNKS